MPFYVLESFPVNCVNANGPRAQVQHDELVMRLCFGEMVEFLKAEVFVSWETLVYSPETLV